MITLRRTIRPLAILLGVGFLVIGALFISGCSWSTEEAPQELGFSYAEEFIPDGIAMTFELNTLSNNQRDTLDALKELFPKEEGKDSFEDVIDDIDDDLIKYGLTFKDDIEPVISDQYRMLVATGAVRDGGTDTYLTVTIKDQESYDALISKVVDHKDFIIEKYGDAKIIVNNIDPIYITQIEDIALLSNTKENITRAIDVATGKGGIKSLQSNERYAKILEKMPSDRFAMLYFDAQTLASLIGQPAGVENIISVNALFGGGMYGALEAEGFAAVAKSDGIQIAGYAYGDETMLEESGIQFDEIKTRAPYLLKDLPGKGMVLYVEGYDLKKAIELNVNSATADPAARDQYELFRANLLTQASIDIDQDLLSWMDQGYTIAAQDSGGFIPGLTLMVDASSNLNGAEKVTTSLDLFLTQSLEQLKAGAGPYATIMTKSRVDVGGNELHKISMDFTQLPADLIASLNLPAGLDQEKIEIHYGITGDDYFVVSTFSGFADLYGDGFDGESDYKKIKKYISGYDRGIFYAGPAQLINYVDKFVQLGKVVRPMTAEDEHSYELMKKYIQPLKGAILSAKATASEVEMGGFIRIEE